MKKKRKAPPRRRRIRWDGVREFLRVAGATIVCVGLAVMFAALVIWILKP